MTEFLTENARRAYPLEHEWPSGLSEIWTRLLVDACISTTADLSGNQRLSLISAAKSGTSLVFKIGTTSDTVNVSVPGGKHGFYTAYAGSSTIKAFLTVNADAVNELLAKTSPATNVGIPFALRCTSSGHPRVETVKAYSPTLCTTPKFVGTETPVVTITGGDVVIAAKDGIDAESVEMSPLEGRLMRLSAIAAPADTSASDTEIDLMIRGDDCLVVETMPGVYATYNAEQKKWIPHLWSEGGKYASADKCGIIRVGSRCKACCQCEDYFDATEALRPAEDATFSVNDALDEARELYNAAVTKFNQAKTQIMAEINSYDNIHATASASVSGGVYSGSTAEGMRSRIAITLIVENMTKETASISGVRFYVNGFTSVKTSWSKAGETPGSGTTISGRTWSLVPGDTLLVTATYAKKSDTNTAEKPSGTKAYYTAKIPSRASSGEQEVAVE